LPSHLLADVEILNLNDFTPEPPEAVVIAADGSWATLSEDADFGVVVLWNEGISTALIGAVDVAFTYDFHLGQDNLDDFEVVLYDPSTSAEYMSMLVDVSETNRVGWDLTGYSFPVGLDFHLNSWDDPNTPGMLASYVTVSNLAISGDAPPPYPVPEASTLLLFGSGGLAMLRFLPGLTRARKVRK
jgi:hypothetical protein